MVATFTPVAVTDPAKEKEWAYQIGRLDWDETKIIFTKRTLLEFLKYTGTSVDTNMSNISKLPRYCQFGKIAETDVVDSTPAGQASSTEASADTSAPATKGVPDFKPTRRVREVPGGKQSINLFEGEFEDDALSTAPTSTSLAFAAIPTTMTAPVGTRVTEDVGTSITEAEEPIRKTVIEGFIPTRRVREAPGGKDSLGSIWGD